MLSLLLAATAVHIAGRIRDFIWHAQHDEFEATRQQVVAHWLLWIAIVATIAVCVVALRQLDAGDATRHGYIVALAAGIAYVPVAVWHFIEHANHNDPSVAHILLAIGEIGMLTGVVMVFLEARRRPRDAVAPSSI